MKIKKIFLVLIIYFFSFNNLYSLEPDIFVQSTVNRASKVLSDDISKERKIQELQNIAKETDVEIIWWDNGCCEVHELFTPEDLIEARESEENLKIIAHPECPPNVVAEADFSGSTARMIEWVTEKKPEKVMMVTECSMSDNIAAENPETKFIRPCNMCPHMKKITLSKILNNLLYLNNEVIIDAEISKRAYSAVDRMIKLDIS